MKTIHVEVTQDMIDRGAKCSPYCCPVALGLRAVVVPDNPTGVPSYFGVLAYAVRFGGPTHSEYVMVHLPEHATEFICTLDGGGSVAPISFTLDIPDWVPLRESA